MTVIELINTLSSSTMVRMVNRCGENPGWTNLEATAKFFKKAYKKACEDKSNYLGVNWEYKHYLDMKFVKWKKEATGRVIIVLPVGETVSEKRRAEEKCLKETSMTRSQLARRNFNRKMVTLATMSAIAMASAGDKGDGPYY